MNRPHTPDLSDKFFSDLDPLCIRLQCAKSDLLGVMMSESGVSASKRNPHSSATGLIQFMADRNHRYPGGLMRDQFESLEAHDQLVYVEQYLRPYTGKLVNISAVYLAVFLPAQIGLAGDPGATVVGKNGPYGWAYNANAYFDFDRDLKIQVSELDASVRLQCDGPRWTEIASRANIDANVKVKRRFDLRTIVGVQQALDELGFSPGEIDGVNGPRTTSALRIFQIASQLDPDGMPGPRTRYALKCALGAKGIRAVG